MNEDGMDKQWTMRAIMERLPGGRRALFARYHLGGCSSCAFSDDETLEMLCQRSDLDADEVLAHLVASDGLDHAMWVSPTDAAERRGDFRWIDVRTREEHEAIPLGESEFFTQELQQQLFAEKPQYRILLFDHTGKHVLDQVAWFRGHGLSDTFALRGGIDAWSQEVDAGVRRYRLEAAG